MPFDKNQQAGKGVNIPIDNATKDKEKELNRQNKIVLDRQNKTVLDKTNLGQDKIRRDDAAGKSGKGGAL